VADGARTHDNRNHNPGLYQLSYSHHRTPNYSEQARWFTVHREAQRDAPFEVSAAIAELLTVTL
jgi:hypothetical protein